MKIDFDEVKAMGELFFTPEEVGLAMGLSRSEVEQLMLDENSDFYKSYHAGRIENDLKLRSSINKLALAGSSPAQSVMLSLAKRNEFRSAYE